MKKIFTLLVSFLFAGAMAFAQDEDMTTLQFVDANGNVVENGSTLKFTVAEEDAFGNAIMNTGLKVKNNSGSKVACNFAVEISKIDNGRVQVCFPGNCQSFDKKGSSETTVGDMTEAEKNAQVEWLPEAYGTCKVKLQIQIHKKNAVTGKYSVQAVGPAITCEFEYSESSSIDSVVEEKQPVKAYNILGQLVDENYKGIVIVNGKKMVRR